MATPSGERHYQPASNKTTVTARTGGYLDYNSSYGASEGNPNAVKPATGSWESLYPRYQQTGENSAVTGDGLPGTEPVVQNGGSGGGRKNYYQAAVLPSATSQADYINAMYNANEQRQRAALEMEYDANVAALNQQAAKLPAQYQQASNAAAAQAAMNRAAFNEMAAGTGINTGAGSQAALAQNNALMSNISSIRQAESEALADVEAQRTSLAAQYQKAIADAVANNEAQRAAALYEEARRVDESLVATAANQATENYRAWQARYG